jgi:hypothetical protein
MGLPLSEFFSRCGSDHLLDGSYLSCRSYAAASEVYSPHRAVRIQIRVRPNLDSRYSRRVRISEV